MASMTPLEREVVDRFLAGDHPILAKLRAQVEAASVSSRDHTGVGLYVNFTVPRSLAPVDPPRLIFGDVNLELKNADPGIAVLLYVVDGVLSFLEFATASGSWPEVPIVERITYLREVPVDANTFSLVPSIERDPAALGRALRGRNGQNAA